MIATLLPAGKLFDRVYSEAILPAAAAAGKEVVRLDLDFTRESAREAILRNLQSAELTIADLTGRNPHVMYLVGLAHALGAKLLLIAQHLEDFPFDPHAHSPIAYAGDCHFLQAELIARLKGESRPAETGASDACEKFLATFGDILTKHGYEHRGGIEMENPTTFVLLNQDMDLALVQDLARKARELGMRLKLM